MTDHILRLITELHEQLASRTDIPKKRIRETLSQGTGIFINAAPRTTKENGTPFYVADIDDHLRIVTTPLAALSAIRNRIQRLAVLPNQGNKLYGNREQFRSSYTPILLDPHYGHELEECDPSIIPEYEEPWHLAYIDRFGNLISWCDNPDDQWKRINEIASVNRSSARLAIGQASQEIKVTDALASAKEGALSIYRNGGIDIVRKWQETDTIESKLARSAYSQFGRPHIGDPLSIET